jgi:hypothetical protein
MTKAELDQLLARNKQLSLDENPSGSSLLRAIVKPFKRPALEQKLFRTQESHPRIIVCFTGYRLRPCDPDNFAGGCKALLDGLRHAGLIPGDEPWQIDFRTNQVKVTRKREERTEITIWR